MPSTAHGDNAAPKTGVMQQAGTKPLLPNILATEKSDLLCPTVAVPFILVKLTVPIKGS